ncbi:RRXRR domain-containing protein [Streptomonospora wellingtoniae]|uniref:RRXRR domain-containing protein n=1 Tax=Streptomonospora wellingtoniae TaxID=3075544 RepID=A0ABU2KWN7_9ACTN|nr:RRXRR domain-containing protein [Streptomonospora sp. DSM 45055]MDT0303672.1 RRXRR domain-containing protein [Streptomonospora sp. DSM 45055]
MLDKNRRPLQPCHPARARKLVAKGRAVVHRHTPFTLRLTDRTVENSEVDGVELGIDPGSEHTGIAVRAAFDTHALSTYQPLEVADYQRGTLHGYEVREYLRANSTGPAPTAAPTGVPLNLDHIHPRSRGGSDRVSSGRTATDTPPERRERRPPRPEGRGSRRITLMTGSDRAPDSPLPVQRPEGDVGEPDLDRLAAELEAEHGPAGRVGAEVRTAAMSAYAARRDDAVMTEVTDDSAEAPPSAVRDAAPADAPRYLRFDAPGAALGLEVTPLDDRRTLVGGVDPPGATSAEVRTPRGSALFPVDEHGAFVAAEVPAGPVSLILHHPDGIPVTTPWMTI